MGGKTYGPRFGYQKSFIGPLRKTINSANRYWVPMGRYFYIDGYAPDGFDDNTDSTPFLVITDDDDDDEIIFTNEDGTDEDVFEDNCSQSPETPEYVFIYMILCCSIN